MAITAVAGNLEGGGWAVNATTSDASGCEELKAAVAGASHYIDYLLVSCASQITVTIGAGETAGAVTTVLVGPLQAPGASWGFAQEIKPARAIKVATATSITVDASGAGVVTIYMQGRTK